MNPAASCSSSHMFEFIARWNHDLGVSACPKQFAYFFDIVSDGWRYANEIHRSETNVAGRKYTTNFTPTNTWSKNYLIKISALIQTWSNSYLKDTPYLIKNDQNKEKPEFPLSFP